MSNRAVALLSGGMDSAVAAALARERENLRLLGLTVDYGQRTRAELEAAREIAAWLEVQEHLVLSVDLGAVGGSALTSDGALPEAGASGIPATYVPARNTVLLALGLALAEARDAGALVLGVNAVDFSGYPDCRPEFLEAFRRVVETGTRAGVEGHPPRLLAPLLHLSKGEIVREGLRLGVPFERTVSCYDPDPDGAACGRCDSCRLRLRGFAEAGAEDPARYV